jgi:hypothetical protein
VVGFAVKVTIVGAPGGGPAVTVTNALWFVLPPAPVATSVYDVLSVGETVTDPDAGWFPVTPEMVTDVAPVVAQVRVALCPAWILAGFAVKLVICGKELLPVRGTPPGGTGNTTWLPPHAVRVAAIRMIANDETKNLVRSIEPVDPEYLQALEEVLSCRSWL